MIRDRSTLHALFFFLVFWRTICHIRKYFNLKPSATQGESSPKIQACYGPYRGVNQLTNKYTNRHTDAHNELYPITLEEGLKEWRRGENLDIWRGTSLLYKEICLLNKGTALVEKIIFFYIYVHKTSLWISKVITWIWISKKSILVSVLKSKNLYNF